MVEEPPSSVEELGRFFDAFYGDEKGYAYSPVLDPETRAFDQHFFKWPVEKARLITHCLVMRGSKEVYYSPALFKTPGAEKEDFLGTRYVWCEFDGNAPSHIEGVPEPTIKVQSSEDKNQHWYWRLDHFETDINAVESISQRIAYQANADLGCWNANRVLRPPQTTHHESSRTVTVLRWGSEHQAISDFSALKELPIKLAVEEDLGNIPAPLVVIGKYDFTAADVDLITATMPTDRSGALAKLAHICMEKGTSNAEALSLLLSADKRWGKYAKRKDQKKRLLGIINYARIRHPVDPVAEEADDAFKVYTYSEFMHQKFKVDWVVPGLIHKKGILILSGPPGVGKSSVTLRAVQSMATGSQFLKWKIENPRKILFVSMEMPREELGTFLENMKFDSDQEELLTENFHILPLGHALKLGNIDAKARLLKKLEEIEPDGVVFDSLGTTIADDMNGDKVIIDTFDFVRRYVNGHFGAFAWFIHHNRKAQIGNKKPNKLEDLYGNQYIGAQITSGMGLWPGAQKNILEVNCLKMRMAEEFMPFVIERNYKLDFKIKEGAMGSDNLGTFSSDSPIGSIGGELGLGDSI